MNDSTYTLVGLGLVALLIAWLVFSLFKKVFGFLFLAALGAGAFIFWRHPGPLSTVVHDVQRSVPLL
jgi:uncharacterized membrane protein